MANKFSVGNTPSGLKKRIRRPNRHKKKLNKRNKPKSFFG